MTADCWLSLSESSRSRLFELEAGLAAGTSRLPAVVRSLSRSLPKLVRCLFRGRTGLEKNNAPKSPGNRPSSLGRLQHHEALPNILHFLLWVKCRARSLRAPQAQKENDGRRKCRQLREPNVNKCVPSLTNEKCTHDSIWRSVERVLLPHCIGNVTICTGGARADCERSERQRTPFARRRDERTVDCDLYKVVRRAQIRRLNKEGLVLALGIPAHYRVRVSAEDVFKTKPTVIRN
jgi:hypothetical protein